MVSIRIPNLAPRVQQDPRGGPQFTAPGVTPQQNAQPQQLQQLGEGLQQLGAGAMRAGDYLTDVRNDAVATKHLNTYLARLSSYENEAKTLTGENAIKRIPQIREEVKALRGEFAGDTFENAAQERMFSEQADRYQLNLNASLEGWERQQTLTFNAGQQKVFAEQNLRKAQLNWNNPEVSKTAKNDALLAITKRAEILGWSDAQLDLELMDATTVLHEGVIAQRVDTDPIGAAKYLEESRAEMNLDRAIAMQSRIRQSLGAHREAAVKDQAYAVVSSPAVADLPLAGKVTTLGKMLADGAITREVHDAAVTRAMDDHKTMTAAEKADEDNLLKQGRDWVSANQGTDITRMPEALKTALTTKGLWDEIEDHAVTKGITTSLGWRLLQIYRDDSSGLENTEWGSLSRLISGVMSRTDQDAVYKLWLDAKGLDEGGKPKAGKRDVNITEFSSQLDRKLELMEIAGVAEPGMTIDGQDKGLKDVDPVKARNFLRRLEREVNARERASGKPMQFDEVKSMVRQWRIGQQLQVGGDDPQSSRPIQLVEPGDYPNAYIVHKGQRVQLTDVLAKPDDPTASTSPEARAMVDAYNQSLREAGVTEGFLDPVEPVDAMTAMAELKAQRQAAKEKEAIDRADAAARQQMEEQKTAQRAYDVIQNILRESQAKADQDARFAPDPYRERGPAGVIPTGPTPEQALVEYNRRVRALAADFDRRGIPEDDPARREVFDRMYAAEQARRAAVKKAELDAAAAAREQAKRSARWAREEQQKESDRKVQEDTDNATPEDYNRRVKALRADFDRRGIPENDPQRVALFDRIAEEEKQRRKRRAAKSGGN